MSWDEIRQAFPDRWLLVEAFQAHSANGERIVEKLAGLSSDDDWHPGWDEYRRLYREQRDRELMVHHTERERLDITERFWLVIRPA